MTVTEDLLGRHAVVGDARAFQAAIWPWLSRRLGQPGGVWWLEGGGDLVMESLALERALETGRQVARCALRDPHGLPSHAVFQLPGREPEKTLAWWKGLVRAELGREATAEEIGTWGAAPGASVLEIDARIHSAVKEMNYTPANRLGAVLSQGLFARDHFFWVASLGSSDSNVLAASLALWLEQHRETSPLTLVASGLTRKLQEPWAEALNPIVSLVSFEAHWRPEPSAKGHVSFDAVWEAVQTPEGAVLQEIGGLQRSWGPAGPLPELIEVEWPQTGSWEEEHARWAAKCLAESFGGPAPIAASRRSRF